jgi:hypothetical protein
VLDGLVGSDVDEEGVDLDEFARPDRGLSVFPCAGGGLNITLQWLL